MLSCAQTPNGCSFLFEQLVYVWQDSSWISDRSSNVFAWRKVVKVVHSLPFINTSLYTKGTLWRNSWRLQTKHYMLYDSKTTHDLYHVCSIVKDTHQILSSFIFHAINTYLTRFALLDQKPLDHYISFLLLLQQIVCVCCVVSNFLWPHGL